MAQNVETEQSKELLATDINMNLLKNAIKWHQKSHTI